MIARHIQARLIAPQEAHMVKDHKGRSVNAVRAPYEKPSIHSETMFETSALACGKCLSGTVGQTQCGSTLQNS